MHEAPHSHSAFLASRATFEGFVASWEQGTLPRVEWTHPAHVAVCAAYTVRFPGTSVDHMRRGIRRYNDAAGIANTADSGYHETLTCLWARIVLKVVGDCKDPWEASCKAVAELGHQRNLHTLYYSADIVRSTEARWTLMLPDLEGPY